jgi:hypothetical protein
MSLGAQLRRAVESSFTDQAREHGAELGKRAAEMRARDPLATFLLDTFTRQVPRYAQRAFAAHAAGDRPLAVEMAAACERAAANLETVRAAIAGNWNSPGTAGGG